MAENTGAPGNVFRVYSDPVSINIECKEQTLLFLFTSNYLFVLF